MATKTIARWRRSMKLRIYRQDNAWHVSFEGSMLMPSKHLDTVIDHLQRKYPGAEIVEPEPLMCQSVRSQ